MTSENTHTSVSLSHTRALVSFTPSSPASFKSKERERERETTPLGTLVTTLPSVCADTELHTEYLTGSSEGVGHAFCG